MNDISLVTLSGRVVKQPVSIADGAGCTFSVASNRSFKTQDGAFKEEVTFADITCWSGLAALCNRKLGKAASVTVVGRLSQQRWDDPATGEKRSRLVIVASQVVGPFIYEKPEAPEPTPDAPPPADFNERVDAELAAAIKKSARRSKKAAA